MHMYIECFGISSHLFLVVYLIIISIFIQCRKDEKRTLEEAEKLRKLQHKNIVRYYDSGFAKFPDWEEWREWLKKKSRLCIESMHVLN